MSALGIAVLRDDQRQVAAFDGDLQRHHVGQVGDAVGEEGDLLLDAERLVVEGAADEEERRHPGLFEQIVDLVGYLARRGDELVVGRALHLVAGDADQRLPGDQERDDRR